MNYTTHTIRLKNGLTVLFLHTRGAHTVYMDLLIQSGSRFEPRNKQGLSHLVEHLVARGANRAIPDNALEDHYLSNNYSASTNDKHHVYELSGHKEDLSLMIRMMAKSLTSQGMTARDMKVELPRVLSEIRQDLADDEILHHEHVRAHVFGNKHPLGARQAGKPAHLKTITLKDVRTFIAAHVQPERAHLKVIGDLNRDTLTRLLNRYLCFDAPQPTSGEITEPTMKSGIVRQGLPERHITHAFVIPPLALKQEITTELLLPFLQAYLHKRVAEPLGLYHTSAHITHYRDLCLLDIYASMPKKMGATYKKQLATALDRFPRYITEARMKKERIQVRKAAEIDQDFFTRLAQDTGWYHLMHGTTLLPGETADRLLKKTPQDLKRAIKRFTDTAPCIVETI